MTNRRWLRPGLGACTGGLYQTSFSRSCFFTTAHTLELKKVTRFHFFATQGTLYGEESSHACRDFSSCSCAKYEYFFPFFLLEIFAGSSGGLWWRRTTTLGHILYVRIICFYIALESCAVPCSEKPYRESFGFEFRRTVWSVSSTPGRCFSFFPPSNSSSACPSTYPGQIYKECCLCIPRGTHPVVKRFLALHKNLFPIKALRDIDHNRVSFFPLRSRIFLGLLLRVCFFFFFMVHPFIMKPHVTNPIHHTIGSIIRSDRSTNRINYSINQTSQPTNRINYSIYQLDQSTNRINYSSNQSDQSTNQMNYSIYRSDRSTNQTNESDQPFNQSIRPVSRSDKCTCIHYETAVSNQSYQFLGIENIRPSNESDQCTYFEKQPWPTRQPTNNSCLALNTNVTLFGITFP